MAASCPNADSLVPDPQDRKSDTDPLVAEPISVPVRGEVDTDSVRERFTEMIIFVSPVYSVDPQQLKHLIQSQFENQL